MSTTTPYHSDYHDHLCECDICRPLEQDDVEFIRAQAAWDALQATPSYVERDLSADAPEYVERRLSTLTTAHLDPTTGELIIGNEDGLMCYSAAEALELLQFLYDERDRLTTAVDAMLFAAGSAPCAPLPVIMEDAPLHTATRPFCADACCPCHSNDAYRREHVEGPFLAGLLTEDEAVRLFSGQQL